MRVSGSLITPLKGVPDKIRGIERSGYDTAYSAEINNDPLLPAMLAAEHSERIHLTTAIAVAFARNPMTMALVSWDLNQYSGGRFSIGLGSQNRSQITRRYSLPWSHPAPRMREFIQAMRAIWTCTAGVNCRRSSTASRKRASGRRWRTASTMTCWALLSSWRTGRRIFRGSCRRATGVLSIPGCATYEHGDEERRRELIRRVQAL